MIKGYGQWIWLHAVYTFLYALLLGMIKKLKSYKRLENLQLYAGHREFLRIFTEERNFPEEIMVLSRDCMRIIGSSNNSNCRALPFATTE